MTENIIWRMGKSLTNYTKRIFGYLHNDCDTKGYRSDNQNVKFFIQIDRVNRY